MKKDAKLPAVIAAEKAEAAELAAKIMKMTERIPQHVMDTPGVMYAQQFKASMTKARQIATQKTLSLPKLRTAMNDVNFYYRSN